MKTELKSRRARSKLGRLAAAAALVAIALPSAHAAGWRTCNGSAIKWNNWWTNMYINTISMPPGSVWDADLQNAMWHWNDVRGAGFNFYVGRDTDGTVSSSNGVNEIYFSSSAAGSALAMTISSYHCYWAFGYHYGLDETDIAFNTGYSWNSGTLSYSNLGSPYNFEEVALHELGHSLGLLHSDGVMATMNSYYPNGGTIGYSKEVDPLPDDRSGLRALYPDGTSETDIAGSAFKRTGTGTSGLVSSPNWAARGSYATIDFTFGNLGTTWQSFNIGFYLSTNDFISTSDTLLGTNTGASAGSGGLGTFSRTLYIPTSVAPGTYYLGFLMDSSSAIAESLEGNNNQQMPRAITIY